MWRVLDHQDDNYKGSSTNIGLGGSRFVAAFNLFDLWAQQKCVGMLVLARVSLSARGRLCVMILVQQHTEISGGGREGGTHTANLA